MCTGIKVFARRRIGLPKPVFFAVESYAVLNERSRPPVLPPLAFPREGGGSGATRGGRSPADVVASEQREPIHGNLGKGSDQPCYVRDARITRYPTVTFSGPKITRSHPL